MSKPTSVADHVQNLRDHGYTVVENAIPAPLLNSLRTSLDDLIDREGLGFSKTGFEGKKTIRIYNLLRHDPAFQEIPVHPSTLPIAEGLFDEGVLASSLSAIIIAPGESAQPLHSDSQMIPLPRPHVPISLNCMWAISDFTEDNGATRIVPGSHKLDHNPKYGETYDTIAAEMPAGSVMFFDSSLWHGGGTNTSDERRYGIACYYCAGWIRQQENPFLGIAPEIAKTFSRRLQELCGYGVYKGMYGHVENHDPVEFLGRERVGKMVWQASEDAARGKAR